MDSSENTDRRAEIQRAADLAQQRAQMEAEKKAAMKNAKAEGLGEERGRMEEKMEQEAADREKKKAFRSMKKERDAGIVKDKERREKEAKDILAQKAERDADRAEKQKYMHQIHDTAEVQQAEIRRVNNLKEELASAYKRAEAESRRKKEEAERVCSQKKSQIERDTRSKKTVAENEMHTSLYKEEAWYRTKLRLIESDGKKLPAMAAQAFIRVRKQKLDHERKEREQDLRNHLQAKQSDINDTMKTGVALAENEMQQSIQRADKEETRQKEESERIFHEHLRDATL